MASVEVKGIERLVQRLLHISQTRDVKEAMNKAVTLVHGQAKALAPVKTGNLSGNIHGKVFENGKDIVGKVYTNVTYAPYVEFGTGIKGNGSYPNKDISLSYRSTPWVYTPDEGETFYYTKGQVAQPFMYPALKRNEKEIKRILEEALHRDIKNNSK